MTIEILPDNQTRSERFHEVCARIETLLGGESDWTAAMATVACELHGAFPHYHWTGFYRTVREGHLRVGPYQGGHGCLDIPFDRGVCGAAASTGKTLLVDDVDTFPGHIGCSSTTRSEIVVPIAAPSGRIVAVLDVDSDLPAAFTTADQEALEALGAMLGRRFGAEAEATIRTS